MKDILKTMVDNNEPYWSADTMDMVRAELEHVYAQVAKADEYEANINEFKERLKIKIQHSREDGDYSEAYGFSKSLDMIENLI